MTWAFHWDWEVSALQIQPGYPLESSAPLNPSHHLWATLLKSSGWSAPLSASRPKSQQKRAVHQQHRNTSKESASVIRKSVPATLQRAMDLGQEKGASSWLTSLPLKKFNFVLHKGAFCDAVALRYGWQPKSIPTHCLCGHSFTVERAFLAQKVASR